MPTRQQLDSIKTARRQLKRSADRLDAARQKAALKLNPTDSGDIALEISSAQTAFDTAQGRLDSRIGAALGRGDYRNTLKSLDARIPIALLPLRVETRFNGTGNDRELWVRAYPDDIHVHSFEKRLTAQEVSAGRKYWRLLAQANAASSQERDVSKRQAWTSLSTDRGVQRARWIAERTIPDNWSVAHAGDGEDLVFPDVSDTKALDWTQAPRTSLLPDKLVVTLYKGQSVVAHRVGARIPDTVFLGPDPFLAENAFKEKNQGIELDDSFAWISDFDKAVRNGLGFRVPLRPSMLRNGRIDRLTVVGVKVSADPEDGAQLLEEQIEAHRYSEKGLSLLPQGTATNNTDRSGTTYSENYDDPEKGFYDGPKKPTRADLRTSDGSELCRALGIDPGSLVECRNADKEEFQEAVGMNKALYPATIGHFVEVLTAPAVKSSEFRSIRNFFTKHVTATGPLPAIRIGDQPYGIVLTSDLGQWTDPSNDAFAVRLTKILRALQAKWSSIARSKVPYVGKPGNASKLMLEILGLSPGSVSFRQRLAHMTDLPLSSTNVNNAEAQFKQKQERTMSLLRQLGYNETGFPLVTSIAYYRDRSRIRHRNMVDRKPPSEARSLDRLGPEKLNFIQWLAAEENIKNLEEHRMPGGKPPRSVLYLLLRHSILLSLQKLGLKLYEDKGFKFSRRSHEKSLHNFDRVTRDLTAWEVLKGAPKKVSPQSMNIDKPLADHLLALPGSAAEIRALADVRRGMKRIQGLSTGRLHQLLADHVDLASYRLDAWLTGMFYRRLLANRGQAGKGLYIGAYGIVEDIRPEVATTASVPAAIAPERGEKVRKLAGNAGFVHTPSLNHATAAGVLMAGYVANADKDNSNRYEINLSSRRTRRALQLVQGVQNDQPIEALLGYQFERGLHERTEESTSTNLNQYIYELREKYPIEAASLPQAGSEVQESTTVYPVVNGLDLLDVKDSDLLSLGVSSGHLAGIREEIDALADSLDAIGDLITSESAYQLVQGKMDRAAGLLNSFENMTRPPELEAHKTPRSTALTIDNLLGIGFANKPALSAESGWAMRRSARARMEAGINRWLGMTIGDPQKIECRVFTVDGDRLRNRETVSLDDLKMQPIDVVYSTGTDVRTGSKELDDRVLAVYRERVSLSKDDEVKIEYAVADLARSKRSFAEVLPLAGYLRTLLTTARPANASDFQPRIAGDERSVSERFGWDVDELKTRVEEAADGLSAAIQALHRKAPNSRQPKTDRNPATISRFFEGYYLDGAEPGRLTALHLTGSAMNSLDDFLDVTREYGIRVAAPSRDGDDVEQRRTMLESAGAAWLEASSRLAKATEMMRQVTGSSDDATKINLLKDAGEVLFGDDFKVVPCFRFSNAGDVRDSLTDGNDVLLRHYADTYGTSTDTTLDTWLQSASAVRENCKRLDVVRTINEFTDGNDIGLSAVQLPYKPADHWLGVEFPPAVDDNGQTVEPEDDTRTICLSGVDAEDAGKRQQILVIDEWSESIVNDREVTGIAYNYNQPNATAPNAVLLALEPGNEERWSWRALLDTVSDTFDRARTRAVEPTHLDGDEQLDVLTPMTIAAFDLNESNISLDYLMADDDLAAHMKADNFRLYKNLD